MGDLDFIQPLRVDCRIDQVALVITPLVIDMLPVVLGLLEPVFEDLAVLVADGTFDRLVDGDVHNDDVLRITKLIARDGKAVLDATAVLARCDRDWFGGLLPDRAVAIVLDVIKVNADFFRQAIQRAQGSPSTLAAVAGLMGRDKATAAG